ncbi:AarF/ABC1/UbiB kinase family protein, partial [Candidatus Woesearchaeota archaeon]|nr:AarF/ABC1/UbiB kinase family protein [Candidatus Woesearchaeota archaeon]
LPYEKIKDEVEHELKRPIHKAFPYFEKEPVASASIAQVHKARLKNGKTVAVKVQRQNVRKNIHADIEIMEFLAKKIKHHFNQKIFDPLEIIEELKHYTEEELDFFREGKNIERFCINFQSFKNTLVPKVQWDYTTERVLVMDFIEGKKLAEMDYDKLSKATRRMLAHRIVNAVLKQVFIDGFFHADPHPGNIIVLQQNRISFVDFGIVGQFEEELKEKLSKLFIHIVSGDIDRFCDSLVELGFSKGPVDKVKLKNDITFDLSRYYDAPLKDFDLAKIFFPIFIVARRNNIKLPQNLVLLAKCVITVESVAMALDPDFNFMQEATPFIEELEEHMRSPRTILKKVLSTTTSFRDLILNLPRQANELATGLKEGEHAIKTIQGDLETLTSELDRSSNRIAYGLLITAFLLSASYLLSHPQPKLLGFPLLSGIGFTLAGILLGMLLFSISNEKKY